MKTFYSLLSLCLIVPSLLFSENSFEKNCNDHRKEAKDAMDHETAFMKEARNTHPDQLDQLLDFLRKALGKVSQAKEKLEQILRILNQGEAKKNLSGKQIDDWKKESENHLEQCNEHIKNLHIEINAATAWKDTANNLLKSLKRKETQRTEEFIGIPFSKETFWEGEDKRRALLYTSGAESNDHKLYIGQFYKKKIHTTSPHPKLVVEVYEGENQLIKEEIALPSITSKEWDQHLATEGTLFTPRKSLLEEFGLELRISPISTTEFLVSQKGSHSNYNFRVFLNEEPLYTLLFSEPPPWQLGALRKPTPFSILNPLTKQSGTISQEIVFNPRQHSYPILDRFVEEMGGDPLAIAQYVQNEIELFMPELGRDKDYFFAPSRMRSPLGTFLEGQGSPWELCDLLIYLLRRAGCEATIICPSPDFLFPSRFVEKLLFFELPGEEVTAVAFPGVLLKKGEETISLFPWIKEMDVEEGYDLWSILPEAYGSADRWIRSYLTQDKRITKHIGFDGNDTVGVLFLKFLEEELKKQHLSLQDVGVHRKVRKKQYHSWEDFPRPQLKTTPSPFYLELCDGNLKDVQLTIRSQENPHKQRSITLPIPSLNCCAQKIFFTTSADGHHFFHLQIDGDRRNELTLALDASDLTLNLEVSLSGFASKTFSFVKGTRAALCLNPGRATSKHLTLFRNAFEEEKDEDRKVDRLLAFVGMAYFEKCSRTDTALAALHKIPPLTYLAVGLAKLSPDPSTGQLVFPQVDMQFFLRTKEINYATRQLNELLIADISSNEHQILRDIFQDPYAISTVKLLEIGQKDDQGLLTFTKESFKEADQMTRFPLRVIAGRQWETLRDIFNEPKEGHLAYAYMTPKLISSEENPPSYTGMGTLIFHPLQMAALISDNLRLMHGGYGSRLPISFLNDANLLPYKAGFSLLKPSDQLLSLPKSETPNQLLEQFHNTWLTADVRPGHKFETNLVSDPVDVVTGAYYIDEVDLTLPGPFPLQIRRNYSNQSPLPGLFGFGWKLGLNPYLHEEGDKLFAAEMDGTVIVYRLNGDRYEVFAEDNPELRNFGGTANPFHAYIKENILYSPDGSRRVFKNRLLKEWIDAVGNTLTFSYKDEQLIRIENSDGNFVRFHYNPEGKISEAFTKDGRWVQYHYTYQGDLDQVTLPNNAVITYTYDSKHQIIRESWPCGRVLENTYDEKGRVIEQRSPVGLQQQIVTSATFKFDEGMTTVTDGEGGTTLYRIHNKQIYKITDPVGYQTLQSWFIDEISYFDAITGQVVPWDQLGAWPRSLKTTQDKRGLITEYRYDTNGNPTSIALLGEDLTGKRDAQIGKQLTYNNRHLCIEELTLNRTTRIFYHDHFSYLPKKIEKWVDNQLISTIHFEYDEKGQLIKQDADGIVTRWAYENGFPVEMIEEPGTEDPNVITTFKYNRQGQCIEKVSSDGIERHEYDIMGNNLVTTLYDRSGKPLSTTHFGYNLNNQMIWQQGPDPLNILYVDYNAAGQVMASRQTLTQLNSTSGEREEAGFAYALYEYDTRGELIEEVNPLGISTCRILDSIGRPTSVTKAGLITRYTYEPGGFVASILSPMGAQTTRYYTTNGLLKKEIYPDGTESSFVYDFFGRPIQETNNGIQSDISYDDLNRKAVRTTANVTETQFYDSRGLLIASTDGEGNTWKKTYDGLGRLKTEISPDGQQTSWNYKEDIVTCYLPSGEKTVQQFECGRLTRAETLNQDGSPLAKTHFVYDPERSLKQEISGNQTISTWLNTLGQPLKVEEGPITNLYHYDACGQCVESIDGESYSTQFQFDPLGRLSKKILPDGAVIQYHYDADSHLAICYLPGSLSWKAFYDLMGRKTLEYLQAGEDMAQQWQYTYEKGLLQQATDPMGRTHTYFYDPLSRLEKETVDHFTRSFTYDNRGLITSAEESGNDLSKVLRSYDTCGRLVSESIFLNSALIQKADQSWSPSSRSLNVNGHQRDFSYQAGNLKSMSTQGHTLSYDYDLSGNLTKKTTPFATVDLRYNSSLPEIIITHLSGHTHTESLKWTLSGKLSSYNNKNFSYTPRGHLKSAGEEYFTFDHGGPGVGTRTSANHAAIPQYGIDAFGKVITELIDSKQIRSTYDALGQTTSRDATSFEWDPWGRLIKVTNPNYNWKASYDLFGRRLKTTYIPSWGFSQNIISLYDPEYEFQEIGIQSGQNIFWKIYGPSSCEFILDNKGNSLGLLNDALGNLIAVLTPIDISWKEELPSVYGPLTPSTAPSSLLSYAQSLTWQGKQQDPTGLIWLGARYYDPPFGRFLSADPVSYPISLNLYSYANGDPINFRDPDGRFFSPFYQPIKEVVLDTLANPRFQGGLRAAAGFTEVIAGAVGGTATALSGVGLVAGGIVVVHGTDNFVAGMSQLFTGEYRDPLTVQFIKNAGFSENTAYFVNDTASTLFSLGMAAPIQAGQHFAPRFVVNTAFETTKKGGLKKIDSTVKSIEDFLGGKGTIVTNADGDMILMRGNRKIRFDVKDPHGDMPHFHLEQKRQNGRWTDVGSEHRYYFQEKQ